jgi:hypothetical protein
MNFKNEYYLLICALIWAGCGSSSRENSLSMLSLSSRQNIEEVSRLQSLKKWPPHFIQTGLSSGIMIEFTGLKKDALLNAKYSSIELKRVSPSAGDESKKSSPEQSGIITLNTTINNLRQAFYKVPPGTYIVRHIKDWAEKTIVENVEIREGNYSVIRVNVNEPRLSEN